MEKLFVQYPNLRSSTRKFDPCIMQNLRQDNCRKCKVFVTSDRFLGEDRQVKLVGSTRRFPYVIIMDTSGCNLRCWFCYSHHFWKPEESTAPTFLSTDDIISQLRCKLEKVLEAKGKMDAKPFTSIRISGGEPIYATSHTLRPYESSKPVDYKLGIDFWLSLIEKSDSLVLDLKKQGRISIVQEEEWNAYQAWPWPTFVSDAKDRVYIRFDTNGIAFGDNDEAKRVHGEGKNADHLIFGLYNLHKAGKLDNLKIWITYSFKGACPNEYYWSQLQHLPTTQENEDYDAPLETNPQMSGYINLRQKIDEHIQQDPAFKHCVDITVEKGINHDPEHNVYMYNPKAFNWSIFETKSKLKLSPVKNDISIIYTFGGGPWGLYKMTPALIKRYFNRGAQVLIETDTGTFQFSDTYQNAKEATALIGQHHNDKNFKVILRPKTKIQPQPTQKPTPSKTVTLETYQPTFGWILSGNPTNWKIALQRNIWGVKPKHKLLWQQINKGDTLFLYATRPISGLIGSAKVVQKMEESKPYWPEERQTERVIYPYRFQFKPIKILDEWQWATKRISISHLRPIYFGGLNPIRSKDLMEKLVDLTDNMK